MSKKENRKTEIKECTYGISGMHCASCEILIEKKVLEEKSAKVVEASTGKGELRIEYEGEKPSLARLNEIFKQEGYKFFDKKKAKSEANKDLLIGIDSKGKLRINKKKLKNFLIVFGFSLLLVLGFLALNRSGLVAIMGVNSTSALPAFFVFGLLAGISSCAALVGGIVLSMSKQWAEGSVGKVTTLEKLKPHLLFNLGRLISYTVFGLVLGAIGSAFRMSPTFSSVLIFGVSILMVLIALQMLGVKALRKFQITAPKSLTRKIAKKPDGKNDDLTAFLMGVLTVLLPCGFTITAQSMAVVSGSPIRGALIMLLFSLGTLPVLLIIGFSSMRFLKKPHVSGLFLKIAGVLILFFAVYNINAQLNVLGVASLDNLGLGKQLDERVKGLVAMEKGVQVMKMGALSYGYEPNYFKIRVGVPTRWEIEDRGSSGCTNAVVSKDLFDGEIKLERGKVSIKEFVVKRAGKYKFSCWMGMISGMIEVVDIEGNSGQEGVEVSSGANGCGGGCGGGGGCNGGCGSANCSYKK